MTASELKYLIATNELSVNCGCAKMADIARHLNVSKVSVCRAVERLSTSGYVEQSGKKILLTEFGKAAVGEYLLVVDFLVNKLETHCHTPKGDAFEEAIVAACALGEISRNGILSIVKNKGTV